MTLKTFQRHGEDAKSLEELTYVKRIEGRQDDSRLWKDWESVARVVWQNQEKDWWEVLKGGKVNVELSTEVGMCLG